MFVELGNVLQHWGSSCNAKPALAMFSNQLRAPPHCRSGVHFDYVSSHSRASPGWTPEAAVPTCVFLASKEKAGSYCSPAETLLPQRTLLPHKTLLPQRTLLPHNTLEPHRTLEPHTASLLPQSTLLPDTLPLPDMVDPAAPTTN